MRNLQLLEGLSFSENKQSVTTPEIIKLKKSGHTQPIILAFKGSVLASRLELDPVDLWEGKGEGVKEGTKRKRERFLTPRARESSGKTSSAFEVVLTIKT